MYADTMLYGEISKLHQDLNSRLNEVNSHLARIEKQNQEIISLLKKNINF